MKWNGRGVSEILHLVSKLACMGGDKIGMSSFQLPCDVQRRGRSFLSSSHHQVMNIFNSSFNLKSAGPYNEASQPPAAIIQQR